MYRAGLIEKSAGEVCNCVQVSYEEYENDVLGSEPARRGSQRRVARDTERARFVTRNKSDCTCAYRAVCLLF